MKSQPNVYIIAGPNGSGKTTFAKQFLRTYANCDVFVNADEIAKDLDSKNPQGASISASRSLIKKIRKHASKNIDFSFETTLSGRTYIKFIKDLKKQGYTIHIYYLWIPDAQFAIERVKARVATGGHDIPSKDIRRRFQRSFSNFWNIYKLLSDHWNIRDNSQLEEKIIARGELSRVEIFDERLFKKITLEEENQ